MNFGKTKSAFTLVELIITITILTILGTLAFLNVRIYIMESKNTKVINDLNSISNSLRAYTTSGKSILGFVENDTSLIPSISLLGQTGGLNIEQYKAGDINYQAFSTQKENFLDPYEERSYKIGILETSGKNSFELAGTYRNPDSGNQYTKIYGSYVSRDTERKVKISSLDSSQKTIELDISDTGFFRIGDHMSNGTDEYIVEDISQNLQRVYLNTVDNLSLNDVLFLKISESHGLIGSVQDKSIPVYEGSSYLPY